MVTGCMRKYIQVSPQINEFLLLDENIFFRLTTLGMVFRRLPCCPEITTPLLVDDIFLKIDQRTIIFLWKGVKCFCWGVQNGFRTIPAASGHPRPNFIFFCLPKKKTLFQWYTFGQNLKVTLHALSDSETNLPMTS